MKRIGTSIIVSVAITNYISGMEHLEKLYEKCENRSNSRIGLIHSRSYEEKTNIALPTGKGALIQHFNTLRIIADDMFPDNQSIQAVQTLLDITDSYNADYLAQLMGAFMTVEGLFNQIIDQDSQDQLMHYVQQFKNRIKSEQKRLENKIIARRKLSGILRTKK